MAEPVKVPKPKSLAEMIALQRKYGTCPKCNGLRIPCSACKGYRADPAHVTIEEEA